MTINGRRVNAHLGPIAVCDVNGDDTQDLVIGAPDDDDDRDAGPRSASVTSCSAAAAARRSTCRTRRSGRSTQFFGVEGGDHLGAAVACAELNGDTFDDIVVGAPGAGGGTGRVYVVYGRTGLGDEDHRPDARRARRTAPA